MISHNEITNDRIPKSPYGRWRALTLSLVYVLMVAHIIHWHLNGKTLAPLELNEVMYTIELGIVTAGFLFMVVALIATAIFGRFFCSWGCHILALQDLCQWILRKLRLRPKPIRSRLMLWAPMAVMFYMFAWPSLVRLWTGSSGPSLHTATDQEGWASFVTEDFWRNLPGPGVTIATFAVCGFFIVYILGSRGFCTYVCPYGAAFRLADKVAPGRIRVNDECVQCGTCTAVCSSGIRVHEEVARYGTVVNSACLKDLDCVGSCPEGALRFGFGLPSIATGARSETQVRKASQFTWWEDALMAAILIGSVVVFRGLYDLMPFLLTLALGVIAGYLTVVGVRLLRRSNVSLNRWSLKSRGKMRPQGWGIVALLVLFYLVAAHSAVIRYHGHRSMKFYELASRSGTKDAHVIAQAVHGLEITRDWGLVELDSETAKLAFLYSWQGKWGDAHREFTRVLARRPGNAEVHYAFAGVLFELGRPLQAKGHLARALEIHDDYAEAHYDLGALMLETGDLEGGLRHLERAVALHPDFADAHYNLAVAYATAGQLERAATEIEEAFRLAPEDPATRQIRTLILQRLAETRR